MNPKNVLGFFMRNLKMWVKEILKLYRRETVHCKKRSKAASIFLIISFSAKLSFQLQIKMNHLMSKGLFLFTLCLLIFNFACGKSIVAPVSYRTNY